MHGIMSVFFSAMTATYRVKHLIHFEMVGRAAAISGFGSLGIG